MFVLSYLPEVILFIISNVNYNDYKTLKLFKTFPQISSSYGQIWYNVLPSINTILSTESALYDTCIHFIVCSPRTIPVQEE